MTTIVGVKRKGKVVIASDSGIVADIYMQIAEKPKVFDIHDSLGTPCGIMAWSGSIRLMQAFQRIAEMKHGHDPTTENIEKSVVDTLRLVAEKEHMDVRDLDFEAILLLGGELFKIHSDFTVIKPENGLLSGGSGGDVAMGALLALDRMNIETEKMVSQAVEIACSVDIYSCEPAIVRGRRYKYD